MSCQPQDFDAVAYDGRFAPHSGWHNDYESNTPYLPAIQQERSEFMAFAKVLQELGINGKCLQIGLGSAGAIHCCFELMFDQAWTIERDENNIGTFLSSVPGPHAIIHGDSRDLETLEKARQQAPFDMLFIDGDHGYREACSDYLRYSPLVRSGGVVAFHDAFAPEYEVRHFIADLRAHGLDVAVIGERLGIGWFQK